MTLSLGTDLRLRAFFTVISSYAAGNAAFINNTNNMGLLCALGLYAKF